MVKQFLKQVTVTGADNSVKPQDLYRLSKEYPFVEWGILLSKSNFGYPRFPTFMWVNDLVRDYHMKINLSGHICGLWVRLMTAGNDCFIADMSRVAFGFKRFQLNYHAQKVHFSERGLFSLDKFENYLQAIRRLADIRQQQIIFQRDGVNDLIYQRASGQTGKHYGFKATCLYDISGGRGVLPKAWPKPEGDYCGYAGGLSPDNLAEQLEKIQEAITAQDGKIPPIWIDAETHLRSLSDQLFDLNKVERFLEIARPYVLS